MRAHRFLGILAVVAILGGGTSVAVAQDGGQPAPTDEEEQFEGPLSDELRNYWSVDRDLPVVQSRLYSQEGKIGVSLFTGLLSSEPFYYYYPIGVRASYFWSDTAGLELAGSFMGLSFKTELTQFLEDVRADDFSVEQDTEDRFIWRANVTYSWTPFYGKFALLQNKLSHFDINIVGGLGVVGVERPETDRDGSFTTVAPELVFGPGAKFYLSESVTLRLDGRFYLYQGPRIEAATEDGYASTSFFERLSMPSEFQLGVEYQF
jgi:outer membrane beta-barrel protein